MCQYFTKLFQMYKLQAWLGHSTIGTTANIYTHLDENNKLSSCHHRNPTRNVKISEQKNCSEIEKMVPLTGLEPVLNRFRWILSPLCLPFHHSGVFNPFK